MDDKLKFAIFIDYDNIEIGVKSTLNRDLDIACILEGINQRGEIVSKVAYGNWGHHPEATRAFAEYGVQMTQRDSTPRGDKNGGDINLALDALEMAFTRDHINSFAIVSGDSDFMPLVNKLKEYNKRVYVVGGRQFTSTILQRNCHEFISYESLLDLLPRSRRTGGQRSGRPQPRTALPLNQAMSLLERALTALDVRGVQPQLGLIKSTMLQLDPAFAEREYGVSSFSGLMEKLEEKDFIVVKTVDNHLVVERTQQSEEAEKKVEEEPSGPEREDALPILQDVLADNEHLLEMGIPEKEVEMLMRAAEPDFKASEFGFQEFGELVNLACDKGLLKEEADHNEILRYYPGQDLHEPLTSQPKELKKSAPAAEAAESEPETASGESGDGDPARRRRRRRRRGGRGRGGSSSGERSGAEAGAKSAFQGGDSQEPVKPREPIIARPKVKPAAEESKPPEPPKQEAAPTKKKASRKKATKKKAAKKKSTRKKAAKKKASTSGSE